VPGARARKEVVIVSCGEALVDLVPEPVAGGGPMNVAIAAARLGGPAAFVGGVSTDAYGDLIWNHLDSNGVDLTLCPRLEALTARAIVEHVPELRFRFEGTDTADTLLNDADLGRLGPGRHIVHGGTLGMFRGATAETLARLVESHDGIVSLDCNVRPQIIDDRARWDHFHERWLVHTNIYKGSWC
jgi:fructokinase